MRRLPLLLLPALACAAPAADPEPFPFADPAEAGPFAVGATRVDFLDERGKIASVEVWYPALPEAGDEPDDYGELSVAWDAYRDAPPDLSFAPWPIVAFSHGFGGIRYQSALITEHLASHGFVVIAPDHLNNTLFDLDPDRASEVAIQRPTDVRIAVDGVLERAAAGRRPLAGLVQDGPYGMMGHSFGGWTSLVVGGGLLDVDYALAYCEEQDPASCRFLSRLSEEVDRSQAVPDPRVAATMAWAPGGWYTFGPEGVGLQDVARPLILGGDLDTDMPYDEEILPSYESLGAGRALATLHGANHWGFTDLCAITDDPPAIMDCGDPDDPAEMTPERTRAITSELAVAWFGLHLRGEARYGEFLDPVALEAAGDLSWRAD